MYWNVPKYITILSLESLYVNTRFQHIWCYSTYGDRYIHLVFSFYHLVCSFQCLTMSDLMYCTVLYCIILYYSPVLQLLYCTVLASSISLSHPHISCQNTHLNCHINHINSVWVRSVWENLHFILHPAPQPSQSPCPRCPSHCSLGVGWSDHQCLS